MSDSESVLKKYPWTLISTAIFIACALVMAIYEQFRPDEVKAEQVVEEESSDLPALVINRETGDFAKLFSKLSTKRIIDMSHSFDETTIYWPTDKPFRWEKNRWGPNANGYWYASANYAASEHSGTHLDSPIHFAEGGNTTDQIDLERLVGEAVVVDIRETCKSNPDYLLTAADLKAWETANGEIDTGAILVIRTGWGRRWPDKKSYLGTDQPGDVANLHFPGIAEDAAEFLATQRKVEGVVIDTPSLDYGQSKDFKAHRVLNGANIYGIENLANAEHLPVRGAAIIALPMKIKGGTGGPVRVMAILPEPQTEK